MDKKTLKMAVKDMETTSLTAETRKNLQFDFIALECGVTRYEVKGEGENVVLVHGYATPYHIYDKLFYALVNSGYRVLRYDLLGRGLSDRAEVEYTPDLFARQLDEITRKVFSDESFVLVGTSMGASICATYTAQNPQKVKKLVLLAPAGADNFKPPLYMKICNIKGIGEMLFYSIAGKTLLKKCASEAIHSTREEKDYYMSQFAFCAKYKGFLRCTLSSLRNTILRTDYTALQYEKVAKCDLPILCIWGTADKTMPYYQAQRLLQICPKAKLITYEGEGHIFVFDEGERTAKDVIEFIKE